jgi:hypothetical protein
MRPLLSESAKNNDPITDPGVFNQQKAAGPLDTVHVDRSHAAFNFNDFRWDSEAHAS